MNVVPGDQIGPYVILRSLGQGGMGQVFLADDSRLHRKVALKHLFAPAGPEGTVRLSLLREAEAIARITHPHVAVVHDVIEQENGAFLVMEYVEGETLADRLAVGRLPMSIVIEFGRQLASGLAAAHTRGIIHRDLKPSNIQVTTEGTVKILDFGVAKVCELLSATATTTVVANVPTAQRTLIGTLGYMSPEQMLGQSVGPASDLFSLGVVLFEMSTGQRLFPVPDFGQILERMSTTLPRAYEVEPEVPLQLCDVIAKMLEIDTAKRLQAAGEVQMRLRSLQDRNSAESGKGDDGPAGAGLHHVRRRLILARSRTEIVRLGYELDRFLAERPHDVDGRLLKDDVDRALLIERGGPLSTGGVAGLPTGVGARRASAMSRIWSTAGFILVVALAGGVLLFRDWSRVPTIAEGPAPPPTPTTTASVALSTSEEIFQDRFGKAEAQIVALNKAGAREQNTAALAVLPDDPRGLAQRTLIDRMPEPGATSAPPAPAKPPAAAMPPTAPPNPVMPAVSETLGVLAKPAEPERDRANRERTARGQLEEGRKALGERQYDIAIASLAAAITTSGRADFGNQPNEAANLRNQARNAKTAAESAQRRADAHKILEEAKAIGASDVITAVQKAREAAKLDPEVEGVNEFLSSLADVARVQGEEALTAAKNHDNRNRSDQALRSYERAILLLELVPGGHKELAFARQRVAGLKSPK